MNRKKQRQRQLLIVSAYMIAILAVVLYIGSAIAGFEKSKEPSVIIERAPYPHTPGPDISWCHKQDVFSLWDCIRNAEYARQQEDSE